MSTTTPNLGLTLPAIGDGITNGQPWGTSLNANFTTLDGLIAGTHAVVATQFKLSALNTAPASASATGTLGEIRIASGFIYVCVATDSWRRAAIAAW